jgi:hypothetical protein
MPRSVAHRICAVSDASRQAQGGDVSVKIEEPVDRVN